jgi:hypothetical protein
MQVDRGWRFNSGALTILNGAKNKRWQVLYCLGRRDISRGKVMHFWIPVLFVELLAMWLITRYRGATCADDRMGQAVAGLIFLAIFVVVDVVTLVVRNW